MDNVTHSLIGLAVGDAVAAYTKKARLPICLASAIANNLPDLDVLVTSTFFRDRVGYLLHHRGHSHTLILAPLFSLLLVLTLWAFWRKKAIPWPQVILVAFLGVPTHLLADSWNSYGVHPFWPWNNSWVYGDLSFIVEPWIWLLLLPPLYLRSESVWGRRILIGLGALILGLAWLHPMVNSTTAAILSAFALGWYLLEASLRTPRLRISVALLALGIFLAAMKITSERVKATSPLATEVAATPFPANPFCWNVIRSTLTETEYLASVEIAGPAWCEAPVRGHSAPYARDSASQSAGRQILGVFRAPRAELSALNHDCRVNAFLRFARSPFWKRTEAGWIVGDLRFDNGRTLSFAEIYFPDEPPGQEKCPSLVPPWESRFSKI